MKSFTMGEVLAVHQQQLTEVNVKTANQDMIFLLGATLHRKKYENLFNELAHCCRQLSACTFLLLLPTPQPELENTHP